MNELKAMWVQPCRAKEEKEEDQEDLESRSEPTGNCKRSPRLLYRNGVFSERASCGVWEAHRRVLHGVGQERGERPLSRSSIQPLSQISMEQVKMLTHVIFAFVATSPDGSIDFGAVSEDDSSPDAAALAEKRFFDLKSVRSILRK